MPKPFKLPSMLDQYFDREYGWMLQDDQSRAEILKGFAGNLDGYWDVKRAALLLDVSPSTIRQYARENAIPAVKVGKSWRFRGRDLMEHLQSQQWPSTKDEAVRIRLGGLDSESIKSKLDAVRARKTKS